MLLDTLAVISLVALAVFILWEGWQRRRSAAKPLARAELERGYVPGATGHEQALFVAAGVALVAAVALFASPPQPPFEGRRAWLGAAVYGWLGPLGIPAAILVFAAVLFGFGLSRRRTRKATHRES